MDEFVLVTRKLFACFILACHLKLEFSGRRFFAPGMGPMPWTIDSEIYPSWARSWCLSAATSVNWFFNLSMLMTFLSLTQAITKHGASYRYAILAGLGLIYFELTLSGTKGKTLQELEGSFLDQGKAERKRVRIKE